MNKNAKYLCLGLLAFVMPVSFAVAQTDNAIETMETTTQPMLSKQEQSIFVPNNQQKTKTLKLAYPNKNQAIESNLSPVNSTHNAATSSNSRTPSQSIKSTKRGIEQSNTSFTSAIESKSIASSAIESNSIEGRAIENNSIESQFDNTQPISNERGSIEQTSVNADNTALEDSGENNISKDAPNNTHTKEKILKKSKTKKPTKQSKSTAIEGSTLSPKEMLKKVFKHNIKNIEFDGKEIYLYSHKEIRNLYKYFGYKPLWLTDDDTLSNNALALIKEIKKAKYHALPPNLYHYKQLRTLKKSTILSEPEAVDILLTDAFITYKNHLANGILNPKDYFPEWNTRRHDVDPVLDFTGLSKGKSLKKILYNANSKEYFVLVKEYKKRLSEHQDITDYPKIPNIKMMIGDVGEAVRKLRERLGLSTDSNLFDEELLSAVELFQQANKLQDDGIVGRKTIRALNKKPINYVNVLTANLERMRWRNKRGHKKPHVWINIPSYQMSVIQNGEQLFNTETIVGRPSRPTPVFEDTLEFVVLAPYWNVPKTIFHKDKLPLLQKDPSSLGPEIQIIHKGSGKIVSPYSVNWRNGGQGYRLRQKPGKKNALGLMKFLFPNRHAIYMHDTPSKYLFNKSNRALSSGCIRLQKAEDFAYFLLKHHNYSKDRIKSFSQRSKEKWVDLDDSLNYKVYIDYLTAWVDNNNKVRYSTDIYHQDETLRNEYNQTLKDI